MRLAVALSLVVLLCGSPVRATSFLHPQDVHHRARELADRAFDIFLGRAKRLKRISDLIRLEGAALCGAQLAPLWGMIVTDEGELPAAFADPARDRFNVDERIRVIWVVPELPADRAGLLAGDVITEIDGKPVERAEEVRLYRSEGEAARPIRFRVVREEEPIDVEVEHWPACFAPADIAIGDWINAYADGNQMIFSTGLMRFFPEDDALALIVGHELAHNVLNHLNSSGRDSEAEADYLGAYFSARAGYDVSDAELIYLRLAKLSIYSVARRAGTQHPSTAARIHALASTVAEIEAKLTDGVPLEPEHFQ